MSELWRHCNFCKKPIELGATYWKCSVSTCNRKGTSYVFCSVQCWDGHVPIYNHRSAWAAEEKAPLTNEILLPPKKFSESKPYKDLQSTNQREGDILVVASKLKSHIHAHSGFNTSASALVALSDHIRRFCDKAIERAKKAERKTVMDRDFS